MGATVQFSPSGNDCHASDMSPRYPRLCFHKAKGGFMNLPLHRGALTCAFGLVVSMTGAGVLPAVAQSTSPDILTFSTVGDSREDPVTFDKASVGDALSGQDAIWLQNTRAETRIFSTIQAQKAQ